MQPNGNTPTPNIYDAILNPATPPKKPFIFGSGKPNKLVMAIFILAVLVLVIVAFSVYSSLTAKNYDDVIGLAQRQEEIIRIADLGVRKAQDPATITYVTTVQSVTTSEQVDTIAFLKKKKIKVPASLLSKKQDSSTDAALKAAEQNNTYDGIFLRRFNDELSDYQKAQKSVSGTQDSATLRELLAKLSRNAKTITPPIM